MGAQPRSEAQARTISAQAIAVTRAAGFAVMVVLASPASLAAGLVPLAAFWAFCYVVTSVIEARGDNDA